MKPKYQHTTSLILLLALLLHVVGEVPPTPAQARRRQSSRPPITMSSRPPVTVQPPPVVGLKQRLAEVMKRLRLDPLFDRSVIDEPRPVDEAPGLSDVELVDSMLADRSLGLEILDVNDGRIRVLVFHDDEATRGRVERLMLVSYRLNYSSPDVSAAVITSILPKAGGRSVQVDKERQLLYVTGSALDHWRIRKFLAAADSRPRVVRLAVRFNHFSDDQLKDFSARFGASGSAGNGLTSEGGALASILKPLPTLNLNLASEANVASQHFEQVLMCEEKRQCVMNIGRELPVKSAAGGGYYPGSAEGTGDAFVQALGKVGRLVLGFGNSAPSFESFELKQTGFKLSIQATLLPHREVRLVTEADYTDSPAVNPRSRTPVLNTMQVKSSTVVGLGQSALLAHFEGFRSAKGKQGALALFPAFNPLGPSQKIRMHYLLSITPAVEGDRANTEELLLHLRSVACLLADRGAATPARSRSVPGVDAQSRLVP